MNAIRPARVALGCAGLALLAGCAGSSNSIGGGTTPLAQSAQRAQRPGPRASGAPWSRVGVATPKRSAIHHGAGTVLVSQTFADTSTPKHQWVWSGDACLTAGTASTPATSIPACGANAPQDPPGGGALQLTTPNYDQLGLAGWHKALPTANGLEFQFTLYAFDGTTPGADGTLLFLTTKRTAKPAGSGGALGYVDGKRNKGLANAYLGIGFDYYGNFSAYLPGGPGFIPETVAIGGAESIGYHYLGGVTNGSGIPSSLPFDLDQPTQPTRPANAPTIDVSLTSAGLLEVAIDIHDGNGPQTYVSETIVGVDGQPAVPAEVYAGFISSTGGSYNTQQINDLTISTLE